MIRLASARSKVTVVLLSLVLAGCSSHEASRNSDEVAAHHMIIGDSLEQAGSLQEATEEFTIVAQLYQETDVYRDAVRRTVMLLLNPANPVASDSSAFRWLSLYLMLPAPENHGDWDLVAALFHRVGLLQTQAVRLQSVADSLSQFIRKQSVSSQNQMQHLQEIENELAVTRKELDRLKAIDVRLSGSRRTN